MTILHVTQNEAISFGQNEMRKKETTNEGNEFIELRKNANIGRTRIVMEM